MTRIGVLILVLLLGGCFEEDETTGSINTCAADLYTNYSSKNLQQCIDVCVKCGHGAVTTCSTSCTMKGAR
jgi:major membrane immunogen (membrane-anchored lipoprotein)